jgi:formate dehydrogenase maturation protein FdhE
MVPGAAGERARQLAARFPEARDALEFCAAILEFKAGWAELRGLVMTKGPALLRDLASSLTERRLQEAVDRYARGEDRDSPESFFARVMLRRQAPRPASALANRCPKCGEPPQCGSLRPEGHGSAFFLVCSLCATEWRFPRAECPECGAQAVFYSSERMPHVQTQICESCRRYLHVVDAGKDPHAMPLVDEIAALSMDVWAREQGFRKIHPNLAGI